MLRLKINTPEGVVYDDHIEQVSLMTAMGEITVRPHHIPMISVVRPGELRLVKEGNMMPYYISGGTLEIRPDNTVVVLVDVSELAHTIHPEQAEQAYERARQAMERHDAVEDVDFAKFQGTLERELARARVSKKWNK